METKYSYTIFVVLATLRRLSSIKTSHTIPTSRGYLPTFPVRAAHLDADLSSSSDVTVTFSLPTNSHITIDHLNNIIPTLWDLRENSNIRHLSQQLSLRNDSNIGLLHIGGRGYHTPLHGRFMLFDHYTPDPYAASFLKRPEKNQILFIERVRYWGQWMSGNWFSGISLQTNEEEQQLWCDSQPINDDGDNDYDDENLSFPRQPNNRYFVSTTTKTKFLVLNQQMMTYFSDEEEDDPEAEDLIDLVGESTLVPIVTTGQDLHCLDFSFEEVFIYFSHSED